PADAEAARRRATPGAPHARAVAGGAGAEGGDAPFGLPRAAARESAHARALRRSRRPQPLARGGAGAASGVLRRVARSAPAGAAGPRRAGGRDRRAARADRARRSGAAPRRAARIQGTP